MIFTLFKITIITLMLLKMRKYSFSVKKLLIILVNLLTFAILYALSIIILDDMYFYEWSSQNNYLYLWVLVIYFLYTERTCIGISLTSGNLIGVILGQHLGDRLEYLNKLKYIKKLDVNGFVKESEKYRLLSHPGFNIWLYTILASFFIGIALHYVIHRTHKNRDIN